jgi:hypothetical protein
VVWANETRPPTSGGCCAPTLLENVLTTFSSYGDVARHRQAEIIRTLGTFEQRAE